MRIRSFWLCTAVGWIWIQVSETVRYFLIVKPEVKRFFSPLDPDKSGQTDVLIVWALWGTLLTINSAIVYRLFANEKGRGTKTILYSTLVSWSQFFVLFWIGGANMGLASWDFVAVPLLLSLIEILMLNALLQYLWLGEIQPERPFNETAV